MYILVIGACYLEAELEQKFSVGHSLSFVPGYKEASEQLKSADVAFDYLLCNDPASLAVYNNYPNLVVFCHMVSSSLARMQHQAGFKFKGYLYGFNGWPTMVNRTVLEVSLGQPEQETKLQEICQDLGTTYLTVDDRVGMVTPRVISMIINEAYYTLQEGTATADDINLAMKLGTNYPYGPFEWADKIGIINIYELLEAVYDDTKDERYKICSLLKKHYLQVAIK